MGKRYCYSDCLSCKLCLPIYRKFEFQAELLLAENEGPDSNLTVRKSDGFEQRVILCKSVGNQPDLKDDGHELASYDLCCCKQSE